MFDWLIDIRLRNDLYCVEWGVKLYSLTVDWLIAWLTDSPRDLSPAPGNVWSSMYVCMLMYTVGEQTIRLRGTRWLLRSAEFSWCWATRISRPRVGSSRAADRTSTAKSLHRFSVNSASKSLSTTMSLPARHTTTSIKVRPLPALQIFPKTWKPGWGRKLKVGRSGKSRGEQKWEKFFCGGRNNLYSPQQLLMWFPSHQLTYPLIIVMSIFVNRHMVVTSEALFQFEV